MTHSALARCPKCGSILDDLGRCDCDYRRSGTAGIIDIWTAIFTISALLALVMGPADGGDE